MIDYSLNTFATEILETQYAKYEAAYVAYELKYGRTVGQWYGVIEGILAKAATPQQAKALMDEEFNRYVNRLWTAGELSDEYAEYEILVWEQKGSGLLGITASLTPDVKKKISDNYKEILAQRLSPVFTRLAYKARTKLENHYYYTQRELERQLDKSIRIVVGVQGLPKGASVQSALYDGETSLARGSILQSDGESIIEVPVKKLLKKGVPDTVVIRVARAKDISFYRKPIRIEQGTTRIEFVLDEMDRMDVDAEPVKKDTSPAIDQKEKPSLDTTTSRDTQDSSGQSADGNSSDLDMEEQKPSAPKEQRGSGGGFTWLFSDDVLTITLLQTTTVDGGTDLIYTLSQSFDTKDMELDGVQFLGYTRLKKESAGQNAYGYDRWTIEEEIKFSMPKTGAPARFFLWVSTKEGSASTYKSSLNLQL